MLRDPELSGLLEGKNAIVTGASRGLGQAICVAFAAAGARVAFTYGRDEAGAAETLRGIERYGSGLAFKVSVLDVPGTRAMVGEVREAWGPIDVLVNNAGVTQNLPVALIDEDDWDRVMDVNVKGTFLTTQCVLRAMIRQKSGTILNIGSLAGERMLDAPIHYCASKAAISGMTRALAKQLSRYHIRVNCLAPGLLTGGVGRNVPEHRLADYLEHCAVGRLGELDEVARFAAFLASDENSFMTGETVVMDGGL